ncbi:MAG TPA: bifunctional proline dehydrogenase/L-glutamate gamma-semialdehyde dehydrogenase [Candidatus Limnocylindria bacterium]|jgi:RHH-type proline utilization regulon transcriptional repressor/proline dehydrogenase/delta 1-pyrroline-5-carboxylate dehydrogenase|nr:bifunctional proline dehydrogenase/L-glutamate gamma-semialdehyde dehydrogenase [Candidatus Limnocylindria bacterium]
MENVPERALERAARLLESSLQQQTPPENAQGARLARMMDDTDGKAFTLELVDRVFRSHVPGEQARRFREFLAKFGTPRYLTLTERLQLRAGALAAGLVPGVVMRAVAAQLRRDSAQVILDGEAEPLERYLAQRRQSGTRVNLNQLGEAILGEEEAARRLAAILSHLANPAVTCISVKISAIFSQINLLDWDGTLTALKERLRRLYRAALPVGKFVNLDMEEYRDLHLTLAAFQQVLDEPEFKGLRAGTVLQAYLPDSWAAQQGLTEWARRRVAAGGSPVKLRLVKGANLAMEAVEAELHGWTCAPYPTKAGTDANFRRMLEFGCTAENARVVNLGVASHNLFDVALALELRAQNGVAELVELEMLEGMANHQARAVQAEAGGLLVYAPVVKRADFNSAMSYLVRRLDENTAPENFLRDLFSLTPGGPAWQRQRERFLAGWEERSTVFAGSRRAQLPTPGGDGFHNAPDTDWTQAAHRAALAQAQARWRPEDVPAAGELQTVLATARSAQPAWEVSGFAARASLLRRCANIFEGRRPDTIALLVHDGKKAAGEADAEISEAVDFANYYAAFTPPDGLRATALGIVVVTPPWNFPYAIPAGGVLAALMAGNVVILKPAPETAATAWRLAQQLWEAGIPRDVLQLFPCADGEVGRALITDPRVAAVVLTGAYETARLFQGWRPTLRLFAETSGKNALVVTAQADRDLAIRDLLKSAFSHAGQKCSAASLGILVAEVYDDPDFRRQLRDATASLRVGPATHPASVVTPLIREPGPALRRALTTLDAGEEWLLEPRSIGEDPCCWSPGIKLGVQSGSWFQQNECFGPVLGLIRAADLDDAIRIQNDSVYGLTGGIHSLDEAEIAHWRERLEVGNAYINRPITGAIVQRQPFGGWKRSAIGPGAKAGGPNYVALFLRLEDQSSATAATAAASYAESWRTHFSRAHNPAALRCEANLFRYRPCRGVILRLEKNDETTIRLARLAAETCGVRLHLSLATEETDAQLAARLPALAREAEFLRTLHPPSAALLTAAYEAGLNWIDAPLVAHGRTELTRWLREQSISETRHRYGQLLERHPA